MWLSVKELTIPGLYLAVNEWIILNKFQIGYYRVNYDENLWKNIIKELNNTSTSIHKLNRAQIIDDAFNMIKTNRMNASIFMELLQALQGEYEYVPLQSFLNGISAIDYYFNDNDNSTYNNFASFVKDTLQSVYNRLTPEELPHDSYVDKLNRVQVLKWMCYYGYEDCTTKALRMFENTERISPNSQASIYCGAMKLGNETHWNKLLELYKSNITETFEKNRLIDAMGCIQDEHLLLR